MAWLELHADTWDEALFQRPTILFFYTDWCGLCPIARDLLQSLQADGGDQVQFCQIDFDACDEIAARYNVIGIPTVLALDDGAVTDMRPGLRELDQYRAMVEGLTTPRKEDIMRQTGMIHGV